MNCEKSRLSKLTLDQLRAECQTQKINGYTFYHTKEELIDAMCSFYDGQEIEIRTKVIKIFFTQKKSKCRICGCRVDTAHFRYIIIKTGVPVCIRCFLQISDGINEEDIMVLDYERLHKVAQFQEAYVLMDENLINGANAIIQKSGLSYQFSPRMREEIWRENEAKLIKNIDVYSRIYKEVMIPYINKQL